MNVGPMRVALLCAGLASSISAAAQAQQHPALPGTFSGRVTFASDYIVRGFSLSNEGPAVQGSLDWESGTGIYAGIFGSSVEFGNDASAEIDFLAGYRGTADRLHYEIGAAYYWFPETIVPDQSFWDVHTDVGYDFGFGDVTLGIAYTTDDYGPLRKDATFYSGARIAVPIGEQLRLSAGVGHSWAEQRANYADWNAGATLQVYDWFSLDARYFDSDNTLICGTLCDSRFVMKISRAF